MITVKVTDNGTPPLSDTKRFTIRIVVPATPIIQSVDLSADSVTITWRAIVGKNYQLQYKSDLAEASWNAVSGDVGASGDSAAKVDVMSSIGQRFYRVVALP